MRLLGACALALVGACHAELADPAATINNQLDGSVPVDVIDAPIDARACEGGDAHAQDPATGTCLVYFATPKPYADALASCTAFSAKLAVIKSASTNGVVLSIVGTTNALIAATDGSTEGTFVWREDAMDPLAGGYTNWRIGEPNNGGTAAGANEDCAVIEGARMGTWDDKPCEENVVAMSGVYPYVCQF